MGFPGIRARGCMGQSAWRKDAAEGGKHMTPKFRFMDLKIWRDAIGLTVRLLDLADNLKARKLSICRPVAGFKAFDVK
jgi:hypothetical protein